MAIASERTIELLEDLKEVFNKVLDSLICDLSYEEEIDEDE